MNNIQYWRAVATKYKVISDGAPRTVNDYEITAALKSICKDQLAPRSYEMIQASKKEDNILFRLDDKPVSFQFIPDGNDIGMCIATHKIYYNSGMRFIPKILTHRSNPRKQVIEHELTSDTNVHALMAYREKNGEAVHAIVGFSRGNCSYIPGYMGTFQDMQAIEQKTCFTHPYQDVIAADSNSKAAVMTTMDPSKTVNFYTFKENEKGTIVFIKEENFAFCYDPACGTHYPYTAHNAHEPKRDLVKVIDTGQCQRIATASKCSKMIQVWDIDNVREQIKAKTLAPKPLFEFVTETKDVQVAGLECITLEKTQYLVSLHSNGNVKLWDLIWGKPKYEFWVKKEDSNEDWDNPTTDSKGQVFYCQPLILAINNVARPILVVTTKRSNVFIYDPLNSTQALSTFPTQQDGVNCMRHITLKQQELLVTSGEDKTIRVWNITQHTMKPALANKPKEDRCMVS